MTDEQIRSKPTQSKTELITKYQKPAKKLPDALETKISRLVSLSNLPINKIANDVDIRDLLQYKYKEEDLPKSFSAIRRSVIKTSQKIKQLLKKDIENEMSKGLIPTILFDEWTSRSNKRFISIIIRFGVKEFTVGLVAIEGSANAVNLKSIIAKTLAEFGTYFDDLICFTADGAAVNKKIETDTGIKIQQCQNHGIHLGKSFIAKIHNIYFFKSNLAVLDSLYKSPSELQIDFGDINETEEGTPMLASVNYSKPELSSTEIMLAMKNLRKTIKRFSNSPLLCDELAKYTPRKPQLDVKTRWNSMINMIRSYMNIKEHIKTTLVKADIDIIVSRDQEKLLESVADLLEPVESAIIQLSKTDANLTTADIVFTEMLTKIDSKPDSDLKKSLKKISSRESIQGELYILTFSFFCSKRNSKIHQTFSTSQSHWTRLRQSFHKWMLLQELNQNQVI